MISATWGVKIIRSNGKTVLLQSPLTRFISPIFSNCSYPSLYPWNPWANTSCPLDCSIFADPFRMRADDILTGKKERWERYKKVRKQRLILQTSYLYGRRCEWKRKSLMTSRGQSNPFSWSSVLARIGISFFIICIIKKKANFYHAAPEWHYNKEITWMGYVSVLLIIRYICINTWFEIFENFMNWLQ